jgi:hypothetical protein
MRIRDQMNGKPELTCGPACGEVKSPLVLWGPYLWAYGVEPRDGTHPVIPEGAKKVAKLDSL